MNLAQKLQLKQGHSIRVLNAPAEAVLDLPIQRTSRHVLLFARNQAELAALAPTVLEKCTDENLVWIAYPKKSGSIKSDLDRDHGWGPVTNAGWEGVRLVSIDETWSAMRFRPINR